MDFTFDCSRSNWKWGMIKSLWDSFVKIQQITMRQILLGKLLCRPWGQLAQAPLRCHPKSPENCPRYQYDHNHCPHKHHHYHLELVLKIEAHLLEFNLPILVFLLQDVLGCHTLRHLNLDVSCQRIAFTRIKDMKIPPQNKFYWRTFIDTANISEERPEHPGAGNFLFVPEPK